MKTLSATERQKIDALKARFNVIRSRILAEVQRVGPAAYQQGLLTADEYSMMQGTYPQP